MCFLLIIYTHWKTAVKLISQYKSQQYLNTENSKMNIMCLYTVPIMFIYYNVCRKKAAHSFQYIFGH